MPMEIHTLLTCLFLHISHVALSQDDNHNQQHATRLRHRRSIGRLFKSKLRQRQTITFVSTYALTDSTQKLHISKCTRQSQRTSCGYLHHRRASPLLLHSSRCSHQRHVQYRCYLFSRVGHALSSCNTVRILQIECTRTFTFVCCERYEFTCHSQSQYTSLIISRVPCRDSSH